MARFGSQTSTYNRLVTVFVAIGSLVSFPSSAYLAVLEGKWLSHVVSARPTVTVLRSSPAPSVNQDGIPTSTCPLKAKPDMRLLLRPSSRRPTECSVLEGPWDPYS